MGRTLKLNSSLRKWRRDTLLPFGRSAASDNNQKHFNRGYMNVYQKTFFSCPFSGKGTSLAACLNRPAHFAPMLCVRRRLPCFPKRSVDRRDLCDRYAREASNARSTIKRETIGSGPTVRSPPMISAKLFPTRTCRNRCSRVRGRVDRIASPGAWECRFHHGFSPVFSAPEFQ